MKHSHVRIAGLATLIALNLLFFGLFNPTESRAAVVFVGFGLLACTTAVCWYGLARLARVLLGRPGLPIRKLVLVVTAVSVILLALQSIGQLTPRDTVAVVAVSTLAWFYTSYYGRKQAQ